MSQVSAYREIPLTRGMVALVDAEDYERVSQHRWSAAHRRDACGQQVWYACSTNSFYDHSGPYAQYWKQPLLHRFILNAPHGMDVDHITPGHTLDCRRQNIRLATRSQNMMNQRKGLGTTSRYKGVYLHTKAKRWVARIKVGDRRIYLGIFALEEDAGRAYDAAATTHFGEFAHLNTYPTL